MEPLRKDIKPFMLINELSKIFHNKMRSRSDASGVSERYRYLLFHLAHNDGANQLELARMSRLKPPTVSVTIQKLEAEGYVRREADGSDARVNRIFLTEKGKRFHETADGFVREINDEAVRGFSADEVETLLNLLQRVKDNLGDKPEEVWEEEH